MGLGESISDFLQRLVGKRARRPRAAPDLGQLEVFAADRKGVEGYIEPRTATSPTTLLLVDRDGDHVRAPVKDPDDAVAWCEKHGLPVYDAQVIGYPRRMRRFQDRRRGAAEPDVFDQRFADIERQLREDDDDSLG